MKTGRALFVGGHMHMRWHEGEMPLCINTLPPVQFELYLDSTATMMPVVYNLIRVARTSKTGTQYAWAYLRAGDDFDRYADEATPELMK